MSGAESKEHKMFVDRSRFGEHKKEEPRSASRINEEFKYTKTEWVISVLNTTRSLFEGHSAIVVEGWDGDQEFIGQYDITAGAEEESSLNTKGYITKIRSFENDEVKRDYKTEKISC